MRKGLYALFAGVAAFSPLLAKAADVCNRVSGKGLMDGVCVECFAEGRCQIADFFIVGNTITKLILGLSGSVMLLMVVYGGFLWLSSAGNSDMIGKGKKVLIGSTIGLIIVFGAYTATQFLVASLVCRAGESCPAVNEIFARPFQLVKPPGEKEKAAPLAPTTKTEAAESAKAAGTCSCNAELDGTVMSKGTCNIVQSKGFSSCGWNEDTKECVCKNYSPSVETGEECNWDIIRPKMGIPSLDGITITGDCEWAPKEQE